MARSRGRRSGRTGIRDLEPILLKMHEMRDAAVDVMTNYPIKSDEYRKATELNDKLNELSEALTGDQRSHWPIRREG